MMFLFLIYFNFTILAKVPADIGIFFLLDITLGLHLNCNWLRWRVASIFIGIDRPAKKLLRWITHHGKMDRSLRVMAIVGPMGIGKTALSLELRNRLMHGGCYDYFQCNVMAQVPRRTDRNILLLQDFLSQVSEPAARGLSSDPSSQAKTMEALVRLVSEHLQDKRCVTNDIAT